MGFFYQVMSDYYPEYYSHFRQFKSFFHSGVSILTYHKLGPRPVRVRLKGLYVSESLFKRQLNELRQSGLPLLNLDNLSDPAKQPNNGVIVTFDDGYENVFKYGLKHLVDEKVTAIQFILADQLGQANFWDAVLGEAPERLMSESQIREWLAAGQMIGSHGLRHSMLSKLSAAEAREEIYASKAKLEDLFGVEVSHFCYPYGDWSPAVMEYVSQAGYKTACTVERGTNHPDTPRYGLKRFTVRYPTRSLKVYWRRISSWWRGKYK